jgi:hypothetical protein
MLNCDVSQIPTTNRAASAEAREVSVFNAPAFCVDMELKAQAAGRAYARLHAVTQGA